MDVLLAAVKEFGVAVAFASILLWFFLRAHRQLLNINQKLTNEVASLRESINTVRVASDVNERLVSQNEKLVTSLESKDQAFIDFARTQAELELARRIKEKGETQPEDSAR